jgi:hypothetical protein
VLSPLHIDRWRARPRQSVCSTLPCQYVHMSVGAPLAS